MEVQRTLVKSRPELWAELSDVEALTRHLAAFGEITITRVEPESTVAWEGEHASGTVELSASGWGTKVTLSADPAPSPAVAEPEAQPEPEPVAVAAPGPARRRWRFWSRGEIPAPPAPTPDPAPPSPTPQPGPPPPPDPSPPQIGFDPGDTEALLTKVLDDLGQAHHRPFTR
jgi:hypothetical protein